jgi:hypothetical protein
MSDRKGRRIRITNDLGTTGTLVLILGTTGTLVLSLHSPVCLANLTELDRTEIFVSEHGHKSFHCTRCEDLQGFPKKRRITAADLLIMIPLDELRSNFLASIVTYINALRTLRREDAERSLDEAKKSGNHVDLDCKTERFKKAERNEKKGYKPHETHDALPDGAQCPHCKEALSLDDCKRFSCDHSGDCYFLCSSCSPGQRVKVTVSDWNGIFASTRVKDLQEEFLVPINKRKAVEANRRKRQRESE